MNPESVVEASDSMKSSTQVVVLTILHAIRDDLLTTATASRTDRNHITALLSRLWDAATPQETMNIIVPYLFLSPSGSDHNSSADTASAAPLTESEAMHILGFLVSSSSSASSSSPVDIVTTSPQEQQRRLYLIAASKVIKTELQKQLLPSRTDPIAAVTSPSPFVISNELIQVLVHQACTGLDTEVSQNCHDSILLLFQSPNVTASLSMRSWTVQAITTVWLNAIHSVADTTKAKPMRSEFGTICVRCTTLIVDIILLNDTRTLELLFLEVSSTDASHNVGNLLCSLLSDLPDDDPLLQVSIYDVLYELASKRPYHPIRTQWLFQDTFVQPLLRKVGVGRNLEDETNEPDLYLGSSALRILIAICAMLMEPSIRNDTDAGTVRDALIRDLHTALRNFEMNGNEVERLSYIDAISSLASTSPTSMLMVLDDPTTCEGWLRLSVAQPKVKAAILVSVANVLDRPIALSNGVAYETPPQQSSSTKISNELCMKLYSSLGNVNSTRSGYNHSDTTELLLKLVQSPIPEIRFGVYRLFEAIAKYSVGGQVLMTNGNFLTNFLLQRETVETTYEGRMLKYNIVQAMYDNSELKQLLSNDIVAQIEQYLSQGPHYRKALQWDVMTMEQ